MSCTSLNAREKPNGPDGFSLGLSKTAVAKTAVIRFTAVFTANFIVENSIRKFTQE